MVEKLEKLHRKFLFFSGSDHYKTQKQEASSKRIATVFVILTLLLIFSVGLYIFSRTYAKAWRVGVPMNPAAFDSIMGRAIPALIAMAAASAVLAVVSLSFQTITMSRVLTPSMIGFDSVFIGTQTVLVFLFGGNFWLFANPYWNYLLSASIMVVVSFLMFGMILRDSRNNVVFLLMFGLVLSGIVGNGARYLQTIMSQNDFFLVQAATSVNVNNMNTTIIAIAVPIMALVILASVWRHRRYDVMSLGPDQAKGLGVAYEKELKWNLVLIAIGMSVSTALIGSLTFLGLMAVNASREIFKTHKHLPLFIGSAMMAAIALVLGQSVMELLEGRIPVTAIINLVGCTYIFYLILKEDKI